MPFYAGGELCAITNNPATASVFSTVCKGNKSAHASLFRHLPVTDRMFGKYVSFQKLTKIEEESEAQIGFGEIEMLTGEENWRLIIP